MNQNLKNLQEEVALILRERGYDIKTEKVAKNNAMLHGIIVMNKSNLNPTFYIESFNSDFPIAIADEIEKVYAEAEKGCSQLRKDEIMNKVGDKQFILSHTFPCIINADKSKELLEQVPFIRLENLAIIFKASIDENATMTINNGYIERFEITIDDLKESALKNKVFGNNVIIPTPNMLRSLADEINDESLVDEINLYDDDKANIMCVLTNEKVNYGASALFTGLDVLKDFADKINDDVVILPSTIHEVILLKNSNIDYQSLKSIVTDVNRYEVAESEFLSNNVYLYDRKMNKIKIVA